MTCAESFQIYVPFPASNYMFKVSNRNIRKRYKNAKQLWYSDAFRWYGKRPDVFLVSLLLTLNIFHTLFYCFYCYFWAGKCRLGYISIFFCYSAVTTTKQRIALEWCGDLTRKDTIVYFLEPWVLMLKLDLAVHSLLLFISTWTKGLLP